MKDIFSIVDDHSRFIWLISIKIKDQTYNAFLYFKYLFYKLLSLSIKVIQIDGGTKFKPLVTILENEGVMHKYTYHHTSNQNRVVKSRHQ